VGRAGGRAGAAEVVLEGQKEGTAAPLRPGRARGLRAGHGVRELSGGDVAGPGVPGWAEAGGEAPSLLFTPLCLLCVGGGRFRAP